MKEHNIIRFYLLANNLKEKLRTGWQVVNIKKNRTESIADHVYGTLILAIAINSEYKLDVDIKKVLLMLTLHETEEITMPDYNVRDDITLEERRRLSKTYVKDILKDLADAESLENLLVEFNERKTKEAKFCYYVDKLEADFQAKVYDLQGTFDYDEAFKDSEYYGNRKEMVRKVAKNASDFWIENDKIIYEDDVIFTKLLESIQSLKDLDIK